jgi:hypothetical protein
MIALAEGMPLVELEDGRLGRFQPTWVFRALWKAAAKTGYPKWWMAGYVVETAVHCLKADYQRTAISIPRMAQMLADILQVIGYGEITLHLELGQPGEQLDLVDLAREAGTGYELAFFNRLRDRLRILIGSGTTNVDLVGLAPCVKKLRSRKLWTRECGDLQEEIVSFVRTQTLAAPAQREISVQVR